MPGATEGFRYVAIQPQSQYPGPQRAILLHPRRRTYANIELLYEINHVVKLRGDRPIESLVRIESMASVPPFRPCPGYIRSA
jgi:hypothetical protein